MILRLKEESNYLKEREDGTIEVSSPFILTKDEFDKIYVYYHRTVQNRKEVSLKRFVDDEDYFMVEYMDGRHDIVNALNEVAEALGRSLASVRFRWYKKILPELRQMED